MDDPLQALKSLWRKMIERAWLGHGFVFLFSVFSFLGFVFYGFLQFPNWLRDAFRFDLLGARIAGWVPFHWWSEHFHGYDFIISFAIGCWLLLFLAPAQLAWALIRRKRYLWLIGVVLLVESFLAGVYAHQRYCAWSYEQLDQLACTQGKYSLEEIFDLCGGPIYWWGEYGNLGRYSDGIQQRYIEVKDDGSVIILCPTYPWMD